MDLRLLGISSKFDRCHLKLLGSLQERDQKFGTTATSVRRTSNTAQSMKIDQSTESQRVQLVS